MNDLVLSLVGTGLSDTEIYEYLGKQKGETPNKKTIDDAIKKAKIALKNMAVYDKSFEIGKALFRLNELYKKSNAIQDYKGCLAIQREIDGLIVVSDTKKAEKPEDLL